MGERVWIGVIASVVGIAIAVGIVFMVIGAALLAWGVLGALVFIAAILLGVAWIYDRRQAQLD